MPPVVMPLLPVIATSVPGRPKIPPHPLGLLDAPRHLSLVMLVVVMGPVLVLLVLKPKFRPLVPLHRSSFLVFGDVPTVDPTEEPLIKKAGLLLMMCAP